MIKVTTHNYIDYCFWVNTRGFDGRPLYFSVWKWRERHNTKRKLWNKIGVQRVWGPASDEFPVKLSSIPQELHRGIIFAFFQFQYFQRTEYIDITDHSMKR